MASPCIGFEIGLGHICWYFRAYICSKILKVLHPCIGFGIGLGHIWGHANAWIWYIHAYAWILYIHVLSHISHIPKAEIFGFMFQYLSSERMGLRFWANPIHNTWLDHGEISRTRCTPNRPAVMCLELSQAVWSNSMESQLELIGIEYYSSPIQGKHNVCQDESWGEISEDVCKKYILAKWQFVGAPGKIIDHVHFPNFKTWGVS